MIKKTMTISTLNRKREVIIYLPHDYNHTHLNCPVMYMHDAQNLFDDACSYSGYSWGISRHLNNLNQHQVIVVGIEHGNEHRFSEYSPFMPSIYASSLLIKRNLDSNQTSVGNDYLAWIVDELKPYIDTHYRTLKDASKTMLVGSSMGGLISLYGGIHYPHVFGNIGVLSPAFWYCRDDIMLDVKQSPMYSGKIFMSVGTREDGLARTDDYLDDAFEMDTILTHKHINHQFIVVKEGRHNEKAWESLLPSMIDYFLNSLS